MKIKQGKVSNEVTLHYQHDDGEGLPRLIVRTFTAPPEGGYLRELVGREWKQVCRGLAQTGEAIEVRPSEILADVVRKHARIMKRLDAASRWPTIVSGGRPATLSDGKTVSVYLDKASLEIAETMGAGNISEGIRAALAAATTPPTKTK